MRRGLVTGESQKAALNGDTFCFPAQQLSEVPDQEPGRGKPIGSGGGLRGLPPVRRSNILFQKCLVIS